MREQEERRGIGRGNGGGRRGKKKAEEENEVVEGGRRTNEENRTSLEKCTHLYDETQGTVKHKCFRQRVCVSCKKRDRK